MGKRTKIAPTLQTTTDAVCVDCGDRPCQTCVKARAELRALIAVAKAAEEHILELAGTDDINAVQPPNDPLLKAVRRLARASGEGGK